MTILERIDRRRFASLTAWAVGFLLVRPAKALASLAPWRPGSRLAPLVVTSRLEVHGSAEMGDVVMRRGALDLKGGGRVEISRLESR